MSRMPAPAPQTITRGYSRLSSRIRKPENEPGEMDIALNNNTMEISNLNNNNNNDDDEKVEKVSTSKINLLAKAYQEEVELNENYGELIEAQRSDPKSPLFSIGSFEDLNLKPELLKGIYQMGWNRPSKIQNETLPMLLAYPPRNLIAQSQNGTGKTAAFVITMLMKVDPTKKFPQILCVAHTLELAMQIRNVVFELAKFMSNCPDICLAVRGNSLSYRDEIVDQIVIGTPGKLLDLTLKFKLFDLKKLNMFILDEADIMVDKQGLRDQTIRMHKVLRPDCQSLFFSATYNQEVLEFAQQIISDPYIKGLKREEECLDNVSQFWLPCDTPTAKYEAIANIYGIVTVGGAIIFCRTKETVNWLCRKLVADGHSVGMLTGDLTVSQRLAVLDRFRNGQEKILLATNVLARGIDIEQVTLVVNYDLPVDFYGNADFENYLHRIGRSGRFGKKGLAVNLIDSPEAKKNIKDIEAFYQREIKLLCYEELEAKENQKYQSY